MSCFVMLYLTVCLLSDMSYILQLGIWATVWRTEKKLYKFFLQCSFTKFISDLGVACLKTFKFHVKYQTRKLSQVPDKKKRSKVTGTS